MEEKFSDVPKKFGVGPKKVGSVAFQETRPFFFFFVWPGGKCLQTLKSMSTFSTAIIQIYII